MESIDALPYGSFTGILKDRVVILEQRRHLEHNAEPLIQTEQTRGSIDLTVMTQHTGQVADSPDTTVNDIVFIGEIADTYPSNSVSKNGEIVV